MLAHLDQNNFKLEIKKKIKYTTVHSDEEEGKVNQSEIMVQIVWVKY